MVAVYDPMRYNEVAIQAERTVRWSRDWLAASGVPCKVDEVALLWSDAKELDSFVQWALTVGGMENFFSVPHDVMVRQDREEGFNVRFEFLRIPGADWRIEAMCVLDGEAPLHQQHLDIMGNGCIVHVSYKLSEMESYLVAKDYLIEAGCVQHAEYQNTYGMFSYWLADEGLFYYKPRVNLRDQLPAL